VHLTPRNVAYGRLLGFTCKIGQTACHAYLMTIPHIVIEAATKIAREQNLNQDLFLFYP
jgi:hypothetical protein